MLPAGAPSTARNITLPPSSRARPACASSACTGTRSSCISAALPNASRWPSTRPRTPMPLPDSKSCAGESVSPRRRASCTTACASGCSLPASRLAARRSTLSSSNGASACTPLKTGRPSVRVPVLSTISVSTLRRVSIASASRNSTPACAARPLATITDIGVASPSAQGQAMISTDTALSTACVHEGSGPNRPQPSRVARAAPSTASTNQNDTRSASRCIGARVRCACATSCTICASTLALPSFSARITRLPAPLSVAPMTWSPGARGTGIGSPVSMDSSTWLRPSTTTPSTGTFSPGRTRRRSPTCTCDSSTSSSSPSSRRRRAVFGARPSRARMAAEVCERAFSSSSWPSRVSETITAAASKYTPTWPWSRNEGGNSCGASTATTL